MISPKVFSAPMLNLTVPLRGPPVLFLSSYFIIIFLLTFLEFFPYMVGPYVNVVQILSCHLASPSPENASQTQ